jgi:signal transduction histidine kinase
MKPDSVFYQYRILGYDSSWQQSSSPSKLPWSHLKTGTYFFEVRAYSPINKSWSKILLTEIDIKPPFWEVWIYRIGTIVIILFAGLFYRKYELKKKYISREVIADRQKAIDMERARIARDFHDGIGATLSQISISSDVASKKLLEKDYNGANEEISFVTKSIHNLTETLRDIIWTLDNKNNKLEDLVVNIRFQAARLLQSKGIKLVFNSELISGDIPLTSEFRRNVFFIMKEVLNNTCKHSVASQLNIDISFNKEKFSLDVQDNGVGICFHENCLDPRQGKGLTNIKHRAEIIGGTLEMISAQPQGTRVKLTVPLSKMDTGLN